MLMSIIAAISHFSGYLGWFTTFTVSSTIFSTSFYYKSFLCSFNKFTIFLVSFTSPCKFLFFTHSLSCFLTFYVQKNILFTDTQKKKFLFYFYPHARCKYEKLIFLPQLFSLKITEL